MNYNQTKTTYHTILIDDYNSDTYIRTSLKYNPYNDELPNELPTLIISTILNNKPQKTTTLNQVINLIWQMIREQIDGSVSIDSTHIMVNNKTNIEQDF